MGDIRQFTPLWGVWEIDEQIGQGTYGKVYRAHRTEYGKTYYAAIKHISLPASTSEVESLYADGIVNDERSLTEYYNSMLQRLLREIDINVSLKGHSNIVSYEDHLVIPHTNEPGFDVIIRMELLKPLTQIMQERPITEAEVRALGGDICSALEYMGKKNILHRDIKPSNIFANELGTYKLGDFGVSRSLETAASGVTMAGTLNYMAPELNHGDRVSLNSDMYSLGLVLYRLCNANRPPFTPLPPNAVTANMVDESNARRFRGEALPAPAYASADFAAIIGRACAYNPRARFSSPSEMRAALEGRAPVKQPVYTDDDATMPAGGVTGNAAGVGGYAAYTGNRANNGGNANNYAGNNYAGNGGNNGGNANRGYTPPPPTKKKKSGNGKMAALVSVCVVLIIALTAAVAVLLLRDGDEKDSESVDVVETTADVAVATDSAAADDEAVASEGAQKTIDAAKVEPTPEPTPEILLDVDELQSKLNAKSYDSAVFVRDVTRGVDYATSGAYSQKISSALINIPVVFTVLYNIDHGYMTNDTSVYLTYEGGRGSANLTQSGNYSVRTLLNAVLNYSDNNASNALMTYLGFDYIEEVCSYYGFDSVVINAKIAHTTSSTENYVSPSDVAGMLELIWNNEFAGGKQFLADNMYITDSTARSGLGKNVSTDYTFMNHNGVRTTLYNECSIVTNGEETYIVVYMANSSQSAQDGMTSLAAEVGGFVHSALK